MKQLDGKQASRRQLTETQIMLDGIDIAIQLRDSKNNGLEREEISELHRELAMHNEQLVRLTGESLVRTLERSEEGKIAGRPERIVGRRRVVSSKRAPRKQPAPRKPR